MRTEDRRLTMRERVIAGVVGFFLVVAAVVLVVAPPDHDVALSQCPSATAGCIVSVDNDLTTFAAVLAGIGAAASLIGLLGVRFNEVQAGGAKFGSVPDTQGLAQAAPERPADRDLSSEVRPVPQEVRPTDADVPLRVEVLEGLGERGKGAPIAVTRSARRVDEIDPELLRDYQSARKVSQQSHFLTHTLGPASRPGQAFSVAIRVTKHEGRAPRGSLDVSSATFFLGRAWGNRFIDGRRGVDGRFGIVTEAYGPFLALCEVEFTDGSRIILDHYCDFDMGGLVQPA